MRSSEVVVYNARKLRWLGELLDIVLLVKKSTSLLLILTIVGQDATSLLLSLCRTSAPHCGRAQPRSFCSYMMHDCEIASQ